MRILGAFALVLGLSGCTSEDIGNFNAFMTGLNAGMGGYRYVYPQPVMAQQAPGWQQWPYRQPPMPRYCNPSLGLYC